MVKGFFCHRYDSPNVEETVCYILQSGIELIYTNDRMTHVVNLDKGNPKSACVVKIGGRGGPLFNSFIASQPRKDPGPMFPISET